MLPKSWHDSSSLSRFQILHWELAQKRMSQMDSCREMGPPTQVYLGIEQSKKQRQGPEQRFLAGPFYVAQVIHPVLHKLSQVMWFLILFQCTFDIVLFLGRATWIINPHLCQHEKYTQSPSLESLVKTLNSTRCRADLLRTTTQYAPKADI